MAKRSRQESVRGKAQLDRRLTDYSAMTRAPFAANGPGRRVGSWPVYAAAAGSALAMATSASADIIHCVGNCTVYSQPGAGQTSNGYVHLLGSAGTHNLFNLKAGIGNNGTSSFGIVSGQGGANVKLFFDGTLGNPFAVNFSKDDAIGPGIAGGQWGEKGILNQRFFSGSSVGNFKTANVPGSVGLQVGGNDYGWIQLEFSDGGSHNVPASLTVIDWDIDQNPNETILAGEAAPTPEPGTMALALLASGAAGVMALRRRRQATSL